MSITVYPAPHGANAFEGSSFITDQRNFLQRSCPKEERKVKNDFIIQSTFKNITAESKTISATNGFVDAAILAYNQHHHLVIRPDDVWLSILTQFNMYVNANAEELRHLFVGHEGQKELEITDLSDIRSKEPGAVFGVDWGKFSFKITKMMAENIKDPSLHEWILPSYTTTTKDDQAVASIIMMATLQKYFRYGCGICCGIPSVTLLGQKSDWEKILSKVGRLSTFGDEPAQWLKLLKPILSRFVSNFDDPNSVEARDFWQKIAHYSGGGSGPSYLSGWITAFCFWDDHGKAYYRPESNPPMAGDEMYSMGSPTPILELDGSRYHRVETSDVPSGWASVPVKLDDNGNITMTVMVAGSVGMKIGSSGKDLHEKPGVTGLDTVTPVSGWWMYATKSEEELKTDKEMKAKAFKEKYGFDGYYED